MKKITCFLLCLMVVIFQFCSSSRKARQSTSMMVTNTYTAKVQPILASSCAPCHMPPGGNKKALNTYEAARNNIDDIIARIQKNPDERGFMPFKHPRLPDSTIQVLVQWKNAGMPQ